jgi:hypothetical protein
MYIILCLPQLGIGMNTIQAISSNSFISDKLFLASPMRTDYVWKNLIIERRISINWVDKLFKGSILYAFWSVLSSPVS